MGKVISVILSVLILGFGIAFFADPSFARTVTNDISFSYCDKPLTYKIGSVDSRFNLSTADLLSAVRQATDTWSQAEGKELFAYDPQNGELTINLVYDERQSLNTEISDLNQQIDSEKNTIDPQIAAYEQKEADFKQRFAALRSQVAYWDSQGGAPPDVYNKLIAEKQSLDEEANTLNQMAQNLHQSTQEYNGQIEELNQKFNTFTSEIKKRPEEGLFNGKDETITIYLMSDRNELVHTLTHEFGHSLGIDHLPNPQAVMYYQTNDQLSLTPDDIAALHYACRKLTIFDVIGERFVLLGQRIEGLFEQYNLIPK